MRFWDNGRGGAFIPGLGSCSSLVLSMGERRAPDAHGTVGRAPTKSAMAFVLILCCGTDAF